MLGIGASATGTGMGGRTAGIGSAETCIGATGRGTWKKLKCRMLVGSSMFSR